MTSVYLFDVMSTLVYDPFYLELPKAFGTDLATLLSGRDRMARVDFECGQISEKEFIARFWQNEADGERMKACFRTHYHWLEGIPDLLRTLRDKGHTIATASNYPVWYEILDAKLGLSALVDYHGVSYRFGCRKPKSEFYTQLMEQLKVEAHQCTFVDDRLENVRAAEALGMKGHHVLEGIPLAMALSY